MDLGGNMSRIAEFDKKTKRAAWQRSGGKCEAMGAAYGLPANQRCNMPLDHGVQYDHITLEANSHDNSLENCAAVCLKCHNYKNRHHDTPLAAKTVRQQDKDRGIKKHSPRGFRKLPPDCEWDWSKYPPRAVRRKE